MGFLLRGSAPNGRPHDRSIATEIDRLSISAAPRKFGHEINPKVTE